MMNQDDFKVKGDGETNELHHSVTDQSVVEHAHHVMAEHRAAVRGDDIWNKYHTCKLEPKEILERGADVINDLLIIINRLTKSSSCKECGNMGYIIERMGGCRDDNEAVLCPRCNGRFFNDKWEK